MRRRSDYDQEEKASQKTQTRQGPAAFREAEQAGALDMANPLLWHLAGVAALRQGDEKQARQYWQQAFEAGPGFYLTRANLADLDKPVQERHAPWPFGLGNWIPRRILVDLRSAFRRGDPTVRGKAATRTFERFLAQHPEVAAVVPMLLDRGDSEGRQLALGLAAAARTPELLAALKDFALSQHGPDELRMRARQAAAKAVLLSDQPVRFWVGGEWREVMLMNYEISGEPVGNPHSRQVDKLLGQAAEALQTHRAGEAESLLKRALESEPEAPDLLNNLASAYLQQGRKDEAIALLREIHRKNPDYSFGRLTMAGLYVEQGELEQAEAMLKPLLSRKRLHVTVFHVLYKAQIQLQLAKGERDSARSWLNMWADVAPDHPDLLYWRLQVGRRRGA